LRMHSAPVYFRRKGRGQYQRAPQEQLKLALAGLERKRQQGLVQAEYEEELKAGRLPEPFAGKALGLLTKPDKNTIEYKALEAAAAARGISQARLMLECGGIPSARALHEARFLSEFFPHGTGFAAVTVGALPEDLPEAEVEAFSIDDVTTTEIDDAFSVEHLADGRVRIGVHIAAPALGITRGDEIDAIARTRLSTVYMPGDKITMLPDSVVAAFTLAEGGLRPALSLYVIVNRETQEIVASETRAERVFVKNNLRHNTLDELVTEEALAAGSGEYPHSPSRCSKNASRRVQGTACAAKCSAIPISISTSKASTSRSRRVVAVRRSTRSSPNWRFSPTRRGAGSCTTTACRVSIAHSGPSGRRRVRSARACRPPQRRTKVSA
jgi:exoribonuclease-2